MLSVILNPYLAVISQKSRVLGVEIPCNPAYLSLSAYVPPFVGGKREKKEEEEEEEILLHVELSAMTSFCFVFNM